MTLKTIQSITLTMLLWDIGTTPLLRQFAQGQPIGTVDIFPLQKSLDVRYIYEYRSESYEFNTLALFLLDSGTVRYTIVDSSLMADSSIQWSVRQRESLLHVRWSDTSMSFRDTIIIVQESLKGSHELFCSGIVWQFPLSNPNQSVFRYSDSTRVTMLRNDTTKTAPDFDRDTLLFNSVSGLSERRGRQQFIHISQTYTTLNVRLAGNPTFADPGPLSEKAHEEFHLYANFPNPFNPSTTIEYSVSQMIELRVTVYNCTGQEVFNLSLGRQAPGDYRISLDGSRLPSGEYFCRLSSKTQEQTRKMLLIK